MPDKCYRTGVRLADEARSNTPIGTPFALTRFTAPEANNTKLRTTTT
jgi:hypothetical protein